MKKSFSFTAFGIHIICGLCLCTWLKCDFIWLLWLIYSLMNIIYIFATVFHGCDFSWIRFTICSICWHRSFFLLVEVRMKRRFFLQKSTKKVWKMKWANIFKINATERTLKFNRAKKDWDREKITEARAQCIQYTYIIIERDRFSMQSFIFEIIDRLKDVIQQALSHVDLFNYTQIGQDLRITCETLSVFR